MRLYGGPRDSSSLNLAISEFKPQKARAGGWVLPAVPAGVPGPCRSLPAPFPARGRRRVPPRACPHAPPLPRSRHKRPRRAGGAASR